MTKKASKPKTSNTPPVKGDIENRLDQRIPVQLLVDYRANGNYLFDFCHNLGTGGIFINTDSPLPHGSNVDLTFTLPDSKETLHTKGRVIWVQQSVEGRSDLPVGMGIQFENFDAGQRHKLEEFLARYSKEFQGQKSA